MAEPQEPKRDAGGGAANRLAAALADLRETEVLQAVQTRMARGDDPLKIIEDCQAGMREVGERYSRREYYLSGLIMAGDILREVMELVLPSIEEHFSGHTAGRVLLGTVQGDIHDLGKNLLVMLLRSAGIEVVDLGVDVPADEIVRAAREVEPDVIGLSGLLLTSFPTMRTTIAELRAALGAGPGTPPIIVGGGQMTAETAAWVGADRWSDNAGAAVPEIAQMVALARAAG
jgi:methanogenic corrinoid protein MtbC1